MMIDDEIFESNIKGLARLLKRIDEKVDKLLVSENSGVLGERLLDNQDLCLFLKITPRTLQRYRNLGLLPFKTICKRNYYRESDVKLFIDQYFGGKDKLTDRDKCQKKSSSKNKDNIQ